MRTPFSLNFLQIKNLGLSLLISILLLFAYLTHNESQLHTQSINNMEDVYHPLLNNISKINTQLETLKVSNSVPGVETSNANIATMHTILELFKGFQNNEQLTELDNIVNSWDAATIAKFTANRSPHGVGHMAQADTSGHSAHDDDEHHDAHSDHDAAYEHLTHDDEDHHDAGSDHEDASNDSAHDDEEHHDAHSNYADVANQTMHSAPDSENHTEQHDDTDAASITLGAASEAYADPESQHESVSLIAAAAISDGEQLDDTFHALKAIGKGRNTSHANSYLNLAAQLEPSLKQQTDRLNKRLNFILKADSQILLVKLDRFQQAHFVVTLVGCLLAGLVSLILSHFINKQVNVVSTGTRLLADGQLDHRIPVTSNDQLGEISNAFNKMADKLQTRELERNRFMEEIDKSAQEAATANAAKGNFLASMSHEIRTPINGILGTADLLIREPLTRSQSHLTETIQRSGNTLLQIINDILDFSKIEAGGMALENEPFNLRDLVEDIGEMAAPAAHAKNLELNYLFDSSNNEQFNGDALRIRQIIMNLVSNAIKFTDKGEVTVLVQIAAADDNTSTLSISVQDTGIGMGDEAQTRIFQPFSQASRSTTRKYGGTGLGLSISKQLADMMNGELSIVSTEGKGSIFQLKVALENTHSNDFIPASTADFTCVSALLVSNHKITIDAIRSQLSLFGVDSESFNSGQQAFAFIDEHAILLEEKKEINAQLVLVDSQLEDMSGLDFFKQLKEKTQAHPKHKKIKLCMVNEYDDSKNQYSEAGIEFTLNKPVRQSALYNCLMGVENNDLSVNKTSPNSIVDEQFNANILLAEDHPINQDIITRMLNVLGCQVTVAENGQIALDLIALKEYDLVLMDCDMPVLDGLSATQMLRESEQKTSPAAHQVVVALTANALSGDRRRCLDVGMDDYLTKPLSMEELKKTLFKWTDTDKQHPDTTSSANDANAKNTDSQIKLIDMTTVDQLIDMDDNNSMSFFNDLLENFTANWHEDFNQLQAAIADVDAEQSRKLAHRLKSASATMGALRLTKLASQIEIDASEDNLMECATRLAALKDTFDATHHEYSLLNSKAA